MLNGIAPIMIFAFSKAVGDNLGINGNIPLLSDFVTKIPLVPIPIYLDERITGVYITNEDKHIDIETQVQPKSDGTSGEVTQRGINSSVTIQMLGKVDSPIISILIAMADIIFDKVVKKEYSVTYINKSITIFSGLVQSFSVVQDKNTDIYQISMVLSKATGNSTIVKAAAPTIGNTTKASLTDVPRP
jgi:hypothetical protein